MQADSLIATGAFDKVSRSILGDGDEAHSSYMPPWGSVLTEGEIWDVVAYLGTFQPGVLSPLPEDRPHQAVASVLPGLNPSRARLTSAG